MEKRVVDLEKIKRLRKKEMSLEAMSNLLGFNSPNGYYYLERGRTKISAERLAEIASILDVKIDDLFKTLKVNKD